MSMRLRRTTRIVSGATVMTRLRAAHIAVEITYPDMDECDKGGLHGYAYSLEEITRACRQAGLRVEHVADGGFRPAAPGQRALFYYGGETGRRGE